MHLDKSIFWFETEGDNQVLVTASGKKILCDEKSEYFNKSKQQHDAWQRAMLYMKYYGIWDATSFACSMDTPIGVGPFDEKDSTKPYILAFITPQAAEQFIYQRLPEKQVLELIENVDHFYNNIELQLQWSQFILRPVCLKVTRDGDLEPVKIETLKPAEIVLRRGFPIDLFDQESLSVDFDVVFHNEFLTEEEAQVLSGVDQTAVKNAIELVRGIDKIPWGGGEPTGKKDADGKDILSWPFPMYPNGLFECLELLGWDKNYGENYENNCKGKDIDEMNSFQLQTMLTRMSRGERFCDGFIEGEIENGNLLKCLERLNYLIRFYDSCINHLD